MKLTMQRIIFIGGASASGKTTLAKKVGKELGLPWLSADYIHDMSLALGMRDDSPETFRVRDYTPEGFYDAHTASEVVEFEIAISHETWRGIKALVTSGYEGVIEGVAVLPSLVHGLGEIEGLSVVYIANEDRKAILEIAQSRGIWEEAHMYSDRVKPREVEFALAYNAMLIEEARKYGYPVVDVDRSDGDIQKVLQAIESFSV